ncbi:DUF4371 domain-containing protein [Citrus sinensis]|uniref:DUF4371 domain-containing protein n=1 Tax=Citrus sinensis TaxID=2711 RepID=A0ACB8NXX6_CITSI|nr:DUF4371 domain-containing protein [Citrus sinensis]
MEKYFKRRLYGLELSELPFDLGQCPPISSYNPNVQDGVRRAYLQMGSYQPKFHNFYYRTCLFASIDVVRLLLEQGLAFHGHDEPYNSNILQEKQLLLLGEALENDEVPSGQGQNHETTLKRFGDTCWGSHYGTLLHIISLFPYIISMLEVSGKDYLYLMRDILAVSNALSQALQRKDQDILNAIKLVEICMKNLQMMRDVWDSLLYEISSFCLKYDIDVPNMNDELNNCFNEVNMELLLCLACPSPNDSFSTFNKGKPARLAQFYPKDFLQ